MRPPVGVRGLMVEAAGPLHVMSCGARVVVETGAKNFPGEVWFSGNTALLMRVAARWSPLLAERRDPRPGGSGYINALGWPIYGKAAARTVVLSVPQAPPPLRRVGGVAQDLRGLLPVGKSVLLAMLWPKLWRSRKPNANVIRGTIRIRRAVRPLTSLRLREEQEEGSPAGLDRRHSPAASGEY